MARRYVLGPTAARKLTELLRGSGEVSRRLGATAAVAFDSEYVAPFTVQWSQSASGGSGAWLVWLPSDKCLIVDGKAVDLTEDLEAAEDPYPSGWYVLKDIPASGGSVFLNVTPGDPEASKEEDQVASAEFSASASETEGDISVLVASVAKDSSTGAMAVKQTITSALVFGTGKGDNAEKTPMPFDVETSEKTDDTTGELVTSSAIVRCIFYFDGREQSLPDFAVPNDGTVYLVGECVTSEFESDSPPEWKFRLDLNPAPESENSKVVNYKLYDFAGGKISLDYRAALVALSSGSSGGAIRLLGTEDAEYDGGVQIGDGEAKIIKFRSGSDSNVVVHVTGDGMTPGGNFESAIITIDVYYK